MWYGKRTVRRDGNGLFVYMNCQIVRPSGKTQFSTGDRVNIAHLKVNRGKPDVFGVGKTNVRGEYKETWNGRYEFKGTHIRF